MWKAILLYGFVVQRLGAFVSCEIFTAQVELESLFDLRKTVSDAIHRYLHQEELRLQEVRNLLHQSSGLNRLDCSKSSKGKVDPTNPLHSFLVIKGLSMDLAETLLPALDKSNIQELSDLMTSLNEEKRFPAIGDLIGAAEGLTRLQKTYRLSTKALSKGCLQENVCSTELSVDDCFELGRQNFNTRNYNDSISWMKEALVKFEDAEHLRSFNHSELSNSHRNSLNNVVQDARGNIITHNLQLHSKATKAEILEYISWAEDILSTLNIGRQLLAEMTGIELDSFIEEVFKAMEGKKETEEQEAYTSVLETYEALCRGEFREVSSINPDLKCSYSTRGNPYYLIGPVMEELVSLDPMIWIFHKVLYDKEIEVIKQIAKPHFKTATVINTVTGSSERSKSRVSKSAWLIDSDDPVIEKVNQRIELLTDLNMETAEELQIANYGLGGMYLPHFDFAHTNESAKFLSNDQEDANRIATLMFYMSNVEAGGATVFPSAKLSIWPEKGSAAFWYNLKPDGSGDYKTKHAACPVLVGSKWVSNKWIHDRGQEFRRRCNLHPNDVEPQSIQISR